MVVFHSSSSTLFGMARRFLRESRLAPILRLLRNDGIESTRGASAVATWLGDGLCAREGGTLRPVLHLALEDGCRAYLRCRSPHWERRIETFITALVAALWRRVHRLVLIRGGDPGHWECSGGASPRAWLRRNAQEDVRIATQPPVPGSSPANLAAAILPACMNVVAAARLRQNAIAAPQPIVVQ